MQLDSIKLSPTVATSLRFLAVGFLVAVLGIPLALVSCVADERRQYRNDAGKRVADSFGGPVRLAGPIVVIPLVELGGDHNREQQWLYAMPARLDMRIDSSHGARRVGIYEVPTLTTQVVAEGEFRPLDVEALTERYGPLRLERARVSFSVGDPRGILDASLSWNDGDAPLDAGTSGRALFAFLPNPEAGGTFSLTVDLRGTGRVAATPVADQSVVTMTSTWPHPSFDGRFLPETHTITDDGFHAAWRTTHLARGFPATLAAGGRSFLSGADLGFSVFEPVDLYVLVSRSVKYGWLFVVLTLVSVLCLELSTGRRFHLVQYGVAGFGIVLFFLALLALSEHVDFPWAYLAAATLLTGMIGCYTRGATREWPITALATGVLALLYGVLFVLLRLEDFALLVGAGVLLLALAMLMWVTRRLGTSAPAADRAPG